MNRLLLAGLAVPVGFGSGAAAVLVHQAGWWLALAMLAGVVTVWWLPTRLPRVAFAGPWAAAVLLAAAPRPEGDYLIPGDARGWLLLAGSVVLLVVALALPDAPHPHGRDPGPSRAVDPVE